MNKKSFSVLSIFIILIGVAAILLTKTNFLVETGVAISEMNDEKIETLIEDIGNGKTIIVFDDLDRAELDHIIDVIFDSPDLFWLDMQYQTMSLGDISVLFLNEKYKDIDIKRMEINNRIEAIVKSITNDSMSEYDKVLTIHDWVCENVSYDVVDNDGDQEVFGALSHKTARCAGYSKLFALLLEEAGIKSEVISGDAIDVNGEVIAHAWNLVYIDEEAYYFDVTWNDNDDGTISYNWFGTTTEEFKVKHFPSDGYNWVEADATDACYYIKNNMYMKTYSPAYIVRMIQTQGKTFEFKCKDKAVLNDAISALSNSKELQKIMKNTGITYISQIKYEEADGVNCLKVTIN
jgi:3,4-dihydroxy-2-butanone 4-phosphate synthase